MKTPEEIKKGLECCYSPVEPMLRCEACPYYGSIVCNVRLHTDALAYIQQMEADNAKKDETIQMLQDGNARLMNMIDEECEKTARLERERDAAVSELPHHCWNCGYHRDEPIEETDDCGRTIHIYCDADYCFPDDNSSWEWRGVQEPPKEEENA